MKTILSERHEHMLKRFFGEVEKLLSTKKTTQINNSGFFSYERGLDHILVREYYNEGYRFIVFFTENHIFLYLRAEYIGGYKSENTLHFAMPPIDGYVPIFSEKIYFFGQKNYGSVIAPVLEYMERKEDEKNYVGNLALKIDAQRKQLKEELKPVLENCALFLGFFIKEKTGRNPYSMKIHDGAWFVRSYGNLTLLFGKRKEEGKLYIFVNKSSINHYEPVFGEKEEPNHLYLWTRVFVKEFNEENLPDVLSEASLAIIDVLTQALDDIEKRKGEYVNSLPDN